MSPTKKKVTASGELRELRDFYFVFRFDEIIRRNKADKSLPSKGLLCPISRLKSALFRTLAMITPIPESRSEATLVPKNDYKYRSN